MSDLFSDKNDIEGILLLLREKGIAVLPNYITNVSKIEKEAREVLKNFKQNSYLFGEAVQINRLSLLKTYKELYNLFDNHWVNNIISQYTNNQRSKVDGAYITYEYKKTDTPERNGYLHFDRDRTIKFMFYITDVYKNNGAFSCIPGSHSLGNKLRKEAWHKTKKYASVKNRIEIDYPDLAIGQKDVIPIEGTRGTMVIFDSDIFHCGGNLEDDKSQRLIFRSHTSIYDTQHSYIRNINNFFTKLISRNHLY